MERLDMRQYLYHGIHNGVYKGPAKDAGLAIFESILKDENLLCGKELNERDVYSETTYYDGNPHKPRISLGFFPFNDKVYDISRSTSRAKDYMPEDLREYLNRRYNLSEEVFEMRRNIDSEFAWGGYYKGITLIFSPKLLEELKVADYAFLYDEICIDEKVPLRKYLVAVSLYNKTYTIVSDYGFEYDRNHNLLGYVAERVQDLDQYYSIKKLLKKYDYDVPVVEFISGRSLDEQGEVLVKIKKNEKTKRF